MMRFLAIVLPPVAVLFCGKPIQALINLLLTICLWVPGAIHAWGVVSDRKDDKRMEKYAKAMASSK
ncbi:YqaE/Pmp3 family membrane protein [Paenalkalicoccus suaedae]|uniref:YqaE/Pmp3 family membrane protein n=1 Tax=Paenalkalicoccus suaedae TaxID=2592382 RepID=A0A859FFK3_9BACI|nr:YqaE/Pmp3 family membrane protein [Paenalkalicoccus suaedae]QKS71919.1 YqaE/Pmp3 family membrane protein [Paenalkalicoccus suaedae]